MPYEIATVKLTENSVAPGWMYASGPVATRRSEFPPSMLRLSMPPSRHDSSRGQTFSCNSPGGKRLRDLTTPVC